MPYTPKSSTAAPKVNRYNGRVQIPQTQVDQWVELSDVTFFNSQNQPIPAERLEELGLPSSARWDYSVSGNFNDIYAFKTQRSSPAAATQAGDASSANTGLTPITETQFVLKKLQRPTNQFDAAQRSVRLWELMNPDYPAFIVKSSDGQIMGWVARFIKGRVATPEEVNEWLIEQYVRYGRVLADGFVRQNFICVEGPNGKKTIVCIDVAGFTNLEVEHDGEHSEVSLDFWQAQRAAYEEHFACYGAADYCWPMANTIKALLYLQHFRPDARTLLGFHQALKDQAFLDRLTEAYDTGKAPDDLYQRLPFNSAYYENSDFFRDIFAAGTFSPEQKRELCLAYQTQKPPLTQIHRQYLLFALQKSQLSVDDLLTEIKQKNSEELRAKLHRLTIKHQVETMNRVITLEAQMSGRGNMPTAEILRIVVSHRGLYPLLTEYKLNTLLDLIESVCEQHPEATPNSPEAAARTEALQHPRAILLALMLTVPVGRWLRQNGEKWLPLLLDEVEEQLPTGSAAFRHCTGELLEHLFTLSEPKNFVTLVHPLQFMLWLEHAEKRLRSGTSDNKSDISKVHRVLYNFLNMNPVYVACAITKLGALCLKQFLYGLGVLANQGQAQQPRARSILEFIANHFPPSAFIPQLNDALRGLMLAVIEDDLMGENINRPALSVIKTPPRERQERASANLTCILEISGADLPYSGMGIHTRAAVFEQIESGLLLGTPLSATRCKEWLRWFVVHAEPLDFLPHCRRTAVRHLMDLLGEFSDHELCIERTNRILNYFISQQEISAPVIFAQGSDATKRLIFRNYDLSCLQNGEREVGDKLKETVTRMIDLYLVGNNIQEPLALFGPNSRAGRWLLLDRIEHRLDNPAHQKNQSQAMAQLLEQMQNVLPDDPQNLTTARCQRLHARAKRQADEQATADSWGRSAATARGQKPGLRR